MENQALASPELRILRVFELAERLKLELRHSWLSDGRRESVAEHSWQMTLLALLIHRHLEHTVDLERTLKMTLVHDLVEAEAGDVPYFEAGTRREKKAALEGEAMVRIRALVGGDTGEEIFDLWLEFEAGETPEARFARALDHLEVQMQHNLADLESWIPVEYELVYNKMDRHCEHDAFLRALCAAVQRQAEAKMSAGGVDVEAVRRNAERDRSA